ncbi:ANTAR domain-containing protein [Streptomyces sp. NPDC051001]|uniref:ANTAR domain-containing protein n=1 Tax=Streptomyces sp. NPDC051001 TaxID=3155795 RepID=UPI003422F1D9
MALREETRRLKLEMASRPVIDMACGVLMVGFACEPAEAQRILETVSEGAGVELHRVAEAVTATTTGTPLPPLLQEQVAQAVQARQADRT